MSNEINAVVDERLRKVAGLGGAANRVGRFAKNMKRPTTGRWYDSFTPKAGERSLLDFSDKELDKIVRGSSVGHNKAINEAVNDLIVKDLLKQFGVAGGVGTGVGTGVYLSGKHAEKNRDLRNEGKKMPSVKDQRNAGIGAGAGGLLGLLAARNAGGLGKATGATVGGLAGGAAGYYSDEILEAVKKMMNRKSE